MSDTAGPLAARVIIEDPLVDGPQQAGVVILNHGDPAYGRRGDDPRALPPPEALFLRLLAYALFAEAVCVPARYIVSSESTFTGVMLGRRLLAAGVVRPERRAEVKSSADLAVILGLADEARIRGDAIDRVAAATRLFHSRGLASRYHDVLLDDLAPGGHLYQRLLLGRGKEETKRLQEALDRAWHAYEPLDAGTPEEFVQTVSHFTRTPTVTDLTRQWAMAKYYITPTEFDTLNTREIPDSAARLLARVRALPQSVRPMDTPAPVSETQQRLAIDLRAHDLTYLADVYAEAVLRVRDELPEAREKFREIRSAVDLVPLTDELSRLMDDELGRQRGLKRLGGLRYTLMMSLTTGGATSAATLPLGPGVAAAVGTVSGAVTGVLQRAGEGWVDRRRRPWSLAIDRVVDAFAKARSKSKRPRL